MRLHANLRYNYTRTYTYVRIRVYAYIYICTATFEFTHILGTSALRAAVCVHVINGMIVCSSALEECIAVSHSKERRHQFSNKRAEYQKDMGAGTGQAVDGSWRVRRHPG